MSSLEGLHDCVHHCLGCLDQCFSQSQRPLLTLELTGVSSLECLHDCVQHCLGCLHHCFSQNQHPLPPWSIILLPSSPTILGDMLRYCTYHCHHTTIITSIYSHRTTLQPVQSTIILPQHYNIVQLQASTPPYCLATYSIYHNPTSTLKCNTTTSIYPHHIHLHV